MIKSFQQLIEIARKLRAPGGCPWDADQTLESLQKEFMEEAEEVKMALDNKDHENLKEELGDLLFNIVLASLIAEEKGYFDLKDVLEGIENKIVKRHTWVFGEDRDKVKTPEEALALWNKNKKKERKK